MDNLLNESRKKSSGGEFSASGTSTSVGDVGTVFSNFHPLSFGWHLCWVFTKWLMSTWSGSFILINLNRKHRCINVSPGQYRIKSSVTVAKSAMVGIDVKSCLHRNQAGIHRFSIGAYPIYPVLYLALNMEYTWALSGCVNAIWFLRKTQRNTPVHRLKTQYAIPWPASTGTVLIWALSNRTCNIFNFAVLDFL
jgi:hypothetical protein